MFSLSLRERILVAAVLSAATLGVAVKHWRDARRESPALRPTAAAVSSPDAAHYSLARTPRAPHQP